MRCNLIVLGPRLGSPVVRAPGIYSGAAGGSGFKSTGPFLAQYLQVFADCRADV